MNRNVMVHSPMRFVLLAAFAACASPRQGETVRIVTIDAHHTPADSPHGWIYAFDRASGDPDACVYVWSDAAWSLGLQEQPGAYGNEVARGRIVDGIAVDFPAWVLRDARNLYVAGHIDATLGDQRIPRGAH
jgi:hypothetical protein